MAAGDAFSAGPTSTAAAGFLDVRPASGAEAIITNIFYEGLMELYWSNGTSSIKIDWDTSGGSQQGRNFHITNTNYLRIKNTDSTAKILGAIGTYTK
jgi:hypothetical protein